MNELCYIVDRLAPRARPSYITGLQYLPGEFERWGIGDSRMQITHFFAQIFHESAGLTAQDESLNYSAERLVAVWPNRFHSGPPGSDKKRKPASEYARNPEKLAELVYGGRMGNDQPGDGFRYHGRGLLQITGKAMYREASTWIASGDSGVPDFVAQPDAVLDPRWCWAVPVAFWSHKGCGPLAEKDDLEGVTRLINGGLTGIAERRVWLAKVKECFVDTMPEGA